MDDRQATNGSPRIFCATYQKFPKELELDLHPTRDVKLVAHFGPKHGHKAFTEEEIARDQIYKAATRSRHWNSDPDNYHKRLENSTRNLAGRLRTGIVNAANLTKMQASGQGTVISSDFIIRFDAKPRCFDARTGGDSTIPACVADRSGVVPPMFCSLPLRGSWKFSQRKSFGHGIRSTAAIMRWAMNTACGFTVGHSVGCSKNYATSRRLATSHYQNIFQAWLLYFRSGLPEHFEWARMHSTASTFRCNYSPTRRISYRLGDIAGGINHCKSLCRADKWCRGTD